MRPRPRGPRSTCGWIEGPVSPPAASRWAPHGASRGILASCSRAINSTVVSYLGTSTSHRLHPKDHHPGDLGLRRMDSREREYSAHNVYVLIKFSFFFFFLRFYLFIHERQRERQRHRPREKQAPCRESDGGLDPGSPGSRPGLKAGAQPLSHLGCPDYIFK